METSWAAMDAAVEFWSMQWLQLVQQLNVVIQLQPCRHEQILNPTHFCFCRPNNLGKNIGIPISCFLGSLKDLALHTTSSLDQQNCLISTGDTCISGWNSSTMTERFRQDGSLYQRMAQDYGSFPPFWDGYIMVNNQVGMSKAPRYRTATNNKFGTHPWYLTTTNHKMGNFGGSFGAWFLPHALGIRAIGANFAMKFTEVLEEASNWDGLSSPFEQRTSLNEVQNNLI